MKKHNLVDLSHTVEHGMITYEGLPGPVITDHLTREASRTHYDKGTEFYIGKIEMVANTGTYIDSPFHRYENGKDLSMLDLASIAHLEGHMFRADPTIRPITEDLFSGADLKGKAVLIHTGWDRNWRTEAYFSGHPFLTKEAALYLKSAGAAIVGIDSLNIDDTQDGERPAHSILLGADIPVVEHMCNLDALPETGFLFYAVPAKVKNFGTFPVRAFAIT